MAAATFSNIGHLKRQPVQRARTAFPIPMAKQMSEGVVIADRQLTKTPRRHRVKYPHPSKGK